MRIKNLIIFLVFGAIYYLIEILFRGYSSPFMFIVGGACGTLIGIINEKSPKIPMLAQMTLGTVIVTIIEFLAGYVLNIILGLDIWDYSNLPYNFMGQICLQFSCYWFALSYFAIKLDDFLRLKTEEATNVR